MLVLRATRTWAGAFLEASSRGNAHHTLTNPAATNTYLFLVCPHDFVSFSGFPAHPHYLWLLVGEWGGGGKCPHWLPHPQTLGFSDSGSFAGQDIFTVTVRVQLSPAWVQVEESLAMWLTNIVGARSCWEKKKLLLYMPSCLLFSFPTAHLWLGERISINTAPAARCLGLWLKLQTSGTIDPDPFSHLWSLSFLGRPVHLCVSWVFPPLLTSFQRELYSFKISV